MVKKVDKRQSVEEKLDCLTSTFASMQDIMIKKGWLDLSNDKDKEKGKNVNESEPNENSSGENMSEAMIYHNALDKVVTMDIGDPEVSFKLNRLRESTSSEEPNDTSDDLGMDEPNDKSISDKREMG